MASAAVVRPPSTLPADFNGWDKAGSPPKTLPADFNGWDGHAKSAAPAEDLTHNPNGEGVYAMVGGDGRQVGIPYSNVIHAQRSGLKLSGPDQARFAHDYTYAPVPGDSPTLSGAMRYAGDTLHGIGSEAAGVVQGGLKLFAPPESRSEKVLSAATGGFGVGASGAVALNRILQGTAANEKKAAHQVQRYTQDAADTPGSAPLVKLGNYARAGVTALSMANPLNPGGTANLNEMEDQGQGGKALGAGLVDAGLMAAPEVLPRIGEGVRGVLAGDVDRMLPGTDTSPRMRYEAAKKVGVDLPPAQATNSPILKGLERTNREGFLSGPMHDELNARNTNMLTNATDETLRKASALDPETGGRAVMNDLRKPFTELQNEADDAQDARSTLDPEAGGSRVQQLGKQAMDTLHTDAQAGYDAVQHEYGNSALADVGTIAGQANKLIDKNARFGQQFPSLESRKVMSVLGDASKLGPDTTVGDAIRSRSALLDLTRDPEIIKSSYMADIQQLMHAHDEAIAQSLPAEGNATWRDANAKWQELKNTYDNPQSPWWHAVRTDTPSNLSAGVGGTSPEAIRRLRGIAGDEGTGIVARNVGEKLLGRDTSGMYDLGGLSKRLQGLPEGSGQELFGNTGYEQLQRLGNKYQELKPFQSAAYTENPEALTEGIGPKTSAGVRQLRDLPIQPELAADSPAPPPVPRISELAMGAVRRGVAEKLLGVTRTDGYNFPSFSGRLMRLNEGYRDELFGPEMHGRLNDIAKTAEAVDTNYNRSGSGSQVQRVGEMYALPTGLPLLQYPLGKMLTSTKLADWLMQRKLPAATDAQRAAAAGAVISRKNERE